MPYINTSSDLIAELINEAVGPEHLLALLGYMREQVALGDFSQVA